MFSSSGAAFRLAVSKIRTRSVLATADLDELEKERILVHWRCKQTIPPQGRSLTFLISATSLGILAVFDRLCETGFVGKTESTKFTMGDTSMAGFLATNYFCASASRGGGTHRPTNALATMQLWLRLDVWLVVVATSVRVAASGLSGFRSRIKDTFHHCKVAK